MIAYHEGEGVLVDLTNTVSSADKITFNDTIDIDATNVQTAIEHLKSILQEDFSYGINVIYNAVVRKGQIPDSKSPDDIARAISEIETSQTITPSGTFLLEQRGQTVDMGASHWYRYVNSSLIPNINTETFTYGQDADPIQDLGADNKYRYIDATKVREAGIEIGKRIISEGVEVSYEVVWGGVPPVTKTKYIDITKEGYIIVVSARVIQGGSGGSVGTRKVYLNNRVIFEGYGFNTDGIPVQPGDQVKLYMKNHADSKIFLMVYVISWPD